MQICGDRQISQFIQYQVTRISTDLLTVGEPVFAAGFRCIGEVIRLLSTKEFGHFGLLKGLYQCYRRKSLAQGYRLGYTNDIAVGMSGGPIFNSQGLLIGINGRVKNRDPDFGVYAFEDGTEPSGRMLEQMVNSSWGIPISTYLRFVSPYSRSANYPLSARD